MCWMAPSMICCRVAASTVAPACCAAVPDAHAAKMPTRARIETPARTDLVMYFLSGLLRAEAPHEHVGDDRHAAPHVRHIAQLLRAEAVRQQRVRRFNHRARGSAWAGDAELGIPPALSEHPLK